MKRLLIVAMVLGSYTGVLWAQHGHDGHHDHHAEGQRAQTAMAEGEVLRIDPATQKMTIKHGELKHLDMPPMTMVFRVSDPAMLNRVKAGDKVRFSAARVGNALTVTAIEPVK